MASVATGEASQSNATAVDGLLAWSAFECSTYSEMSGEPTKETERLFLLGYEAGRRFFDAVLKKEISEAEVQSKVPIGLLWNAQGPTVDFRLGRIYAVSTQEAYDKVVKHDDLGSDLPASKWRMDKELQKPIAASEYRKQNCALLK
jgi:hypothetical protein